MFSGSTGTGYLQGELGIPQRKGGELPALAGLPKGGYVASLSTLPSASQLVLELN